MKLNYSVFIFFIILSVLGCKDECEKLNCQNGFECVDDSCQCDGFEVGSNCYRVEDGYYPITLLEDNTGCYSELLGIRSHLSEEEKPRKCYNFNNTGSKLFLCLTESEIKADSLYEFNDMALLNNFNFPCEKLLEYGEYYGADLKYSEKESTTKFEFQFFSYLTSNYDLGKTLLGEKLIIEVRTK